jgi:hypothetical protein
MTQNLYSTEDTELAHTETAYTHPTIPTDHTTTISLQDKGKNILVLRKGDHRHGMPDPADWLSSQ